MWNCMCVWGSMKSPQKEMREMAGWRSKNSLWEEGSGKALLALEDRAEEERQKRLAVPFVFGKEESFGDLVGSVFE